MERGVDEIQHHGFPIVLFCILPCSLLMLKKVQVHLTFDWISS